MKGIVAYLRKYFSPPNYSSCGLRITTRQDWGYASGLHMYYILDRHMFIYYFDKRPGSRFKYIRLKGSD